MTLPTDHAGLEVLPFNSCLSLLGAVSGSVSSLVAHHATCPVVIIPPADRQ